MASIELKSVCVDFPIYGMSSRSLKKSLIRMSTGGRLGADSKAITVRALDAVTLSICHGDRVGLIGHNGSGKSTLLRIISKIYEPTYGECAIEGKVYTLLDMMLGMDPESTGYENILIRGVINGLTRKQILLKKDEISEFTELGDYLSLPVRTYSSGMRLRLAFGMATAIFPEILILDEIVGVGDSAFIEKAQKRFDEMINTSHIVVLASHDVNIIKKFCTKVVWLDAGKLMFIGDVDEGIAHYHDYYATNVKT